MKTDKDAVIYATQDVRHLDLSKALEFGGSIVALTPYGDANFSTDSTVDRLWDQLKYFDPSKDKILLVGDPLVMFMVGSVLTHVHEGPFSILKWNRMTNRYIEIHVDTM